MSWYWQLNKAHNKALHSDCQKWRGFRYATATPLLAAGELGRYIEGHLPFISS